MADMTSYPENLDRLVALVRERRRDQTMVALIIDSPWLPGYAGVKSLDFYFDPPTWLDVWKQAHHDLPSAVFVPGSWIEGSKHITTCRRRCSCPGPGSSWA